jgi:phosphoserine aminotransferase
VEQRCYNFSAGPATLPLKALQKAQEDLSCFPGAGASVMEISHRSKEFAAIHAQTKENIKSLLKLPDNYHVLFLQGGASMQFAMLGMNLLQGKSADYVQTGSWANKAIAEAKRFGEVNIAWNGKEDNFNRMPQSSELSLNPDAAFVHFTANETIQGIQFASAPESNGVPLICDMSSEILSRPIDVEKYGLIYAGAQKNIGPSGLALVIIRDDMLQGLPENTPSMLDYSVLVKNDSLYNTPPTFGIYMVGLTTQWLLDEIGGLDKVAEHNQAKAQLLYDTIDNSGGFYKGHALLDSRSLMNVTFTMADEATEKEFVTQATAKGMVGLKGHRSVGGCRASIYNAMPVEGCQALADFMVEFQKTKG